MKAFFNSKHWLKVEIMRLMALILISAVNAGNQAWAMAEIGANGHANHSKLNAWQKDASNAIHFMENKGQVLDFSGNPASFVHFALDRGQTKIFLLKEPGIAWQFQQVHLPLESANSNNLKSSSMGEEIFPDDIRTESYRMDMMLEGADINAAISTTGKSEDYFNFHRYGATDVHHYERVTYHNVYPGIDWVVYTHETGVKYDFVVHPGADPNVIRLKFKHQEELYLDYDGNLIHGNRMGSFTELAPVSFQSGKEIATSFILNGDEIRFELDNYNPNEVLTIDPARIWATYYGDVEADLGFATATDSDNNVYLVGDTFSNTNIAAGGHQNTFGGDQMAFVVKFNASGVRQWATYFGGSGADFGNSVATDADNNVYLSGYTSSLDNIAFNAHQSTFGGGEFDAFIAKFNAAGVLQWSTYYGGDESDSGFACVADSDGNVYLAGHTASASGIASSGHQNTYGGGTRDAFLVKFNTSGVRQWATYYGGSAADEGRGCAVDSGDDVYLVGQTGSTSGIAASGHQNTYGGGSNDAFLAKFNSAGARLWATYYGGTSTDVGRSCATDSDDNVFIVGSTMSFGGISDNGHQNTLGGGQDAFVAKFNAGGTRQWGTYYGGTGFDGGWGCTTDSFGNVYLSGDTDSPSGIASGGFQNTIAGGFDAYLAKLNAAGGLEWGTYYGGGSAEVGLSCATDSDNNVYMAGRTQSTSGIAQDGHQNTYGGGAFDAYLVKFEGAEQTPCIHEVMSAAITAPTNADMTLIATCASAGTYNEIDDVSSGETYLFESTNGTDWLVLTDDENNVLAQGTTPLSWFADFTGTVRLHISDDEECGTSFSCRTTWVTCTSCAVVSCAFEDAFGSGSASGVNIVVSITTCVFAGEYSVIENIAAGSTYEFTSSVETDWLVLTDAANNTLVEGTTPISWNATFSGTVRLHVSAASDCSTEMECRETTVQCTSCPSPTGCIHGQQYELVSAPSSNEVNTIINCSFAGEYNTILDIVAGQTYSFSSSTSSDWLVLTDNADNLLLEGDSPISWTATFSGSVRLHISTDPNCGSQNLCRDITIVCTSCPGSASICCDDPFVGAGCPQYPGCEDAICALDPFCCDVAWDADCVTAALLLCGVEECTPIECVAPTVNFNSFIDCSTGTYELSVDIGDNGNASFYQVQIGAPACDEPQSFVGFPDDVACQDAICAIDVFCCVIEWDAACAAAASSNSACTGCLAPQATTIGLFQGGTSGVLGTFPIGTEVDVYILHNWSSTCSQFFTVGATGSCGCTDPEATNFDPDATFDDGSCNYTLFNNNCSGAVSLNVVEWPAVSNTLGTLTGATGSGLPACTGVSGSDVFYSFHAATHNHYIINLNAFGGFEGAVVELWDGCSGSLVECFAADPTTDCGQAQGFGNAGFPADLTCEAAVCSQDPFCCDNTWDGLCAGIALNEEATACAGCLGGDPAFPALALELPAGDYILRVRNEDGSLITDATGDFLIGVQSFPVAQVQNNPSNPLFACNQTGFQLEDIIGASPQTMSALSILDYEWLIAEIGGGTTNEFQRGQPNYSTFIWWLGMEYGKTYNVFVRVLVDHPVFGPTWGIYQGDLLNPNAPGASDCTVATSNNITPTEVRPEYTPTNPQGNAYALCDIVVAFNVSESENFRWLFDDGSGTPIEYVRNAPNPGVRLSWVDGLVPGTTYQVSVEVQVDGDWSGYGNAYPITLALPPNDVAVRPQYCGVTHAPNGILIAQSVCAADFYEWEFVNLSTGVTSTAQRPNPGISLNWNQISPLLTAGDYEARVRVQQGGILGDYGPICTFTISGPEAPADETPALRTMAENSSMLYPNPNMGTEVRLELAGLGDENHEVMIQIYDITGQLIQNEGFGHVGDSVSRLIHFSRNLATGMYMVHVVVDGERFATERMVVVH